jgi:uncharacterized protein YutE (UPF0331/DUF86 family)
MIRRSVDWRTITAKLVVMQQRLRELQLIGADLGWWEFAPPPADDTGVPPDRLKALAVERILILVVDLAVDINNHVAAAELGQVADDYKMTFPLAVKAGLITRELADKLAPSAGTRNVLVHQYLDVDPHKIVLAASLAVEQYGAYVRQVTAYVQKRSGGR